MIDIPETDIQHGETENQHSARTGMDEPDDPAIEVGYVPIKLHVKTFTSDFSLLPDELPTGKLSPVPFIEGFRASLEDIMAAVELKYHMNPSAVQQWREFLQAYCTVG